MINFTIMNKLRSDGYVKTPPLWYFDAIHDLVQLSLPSLDVKPLSLSIEKLPLGKLVEQFVFHEIRNSPNSIMLAENLQVSRDKISIGEIDCLLKEAEELVHLEIVYKFYLYDEKSGQGELHKWIGPNRKDDLIQKLTKLKDKQLPLLYKKETQTVLEHLSKDLGIPFTSSDFNQKVLFKAQLFVPKELLLNSFPVINNDCIKGFYLPFSDLETLKTNSFYIPTKLDWLVEPHQEVEWLDFTTFYTEIQDYMINRRSPLCWLKKPNKSMEKFFVVWW